MILNREALLSLPYPAPEKVDIGGERFCYVRIMSAAEKEACEATQQKDQKSENVNYRAILVRHTACDESGSLLFTDDDIPVLSKMSFDIIQPLFFTAMRINCMLTNAVDDAEKN